MSVLLDIANGISAALVVSMDGADAHEIEVTFDKWIKEPLQQLEEGKIYVAIVPKSFGILERATRKQDRNFYEYGVTWTRRYTESELSTDAARLTAIGTDLNGFRTFVYDTVASNSFAPVAGANLNDATITEICRRDVLREYGLFHSEMNVSYWIDETN